MGVKGRYGADVVSDVIKRLVLVVALVRRGVHWADDQLAMAGHDKRPVSVKDFVEFRPLKHCLRDAVDSAVEFGAVSVWTTSGGGC